MLEMFGMKVISSPLVPKYRIEQIRQHQQRRTQRKSYHDRINKKWLKRFGTRQVEVGGYLINPNALRIFGMPGGGQQVLVMNPEQLARLKQGIDDNVFRR